MMLVLMMLRYCNMQGKHKNDEHQLWRLKVSSNFAPHSSFSSSWSLIIVTFTNTIDFANLRQTVV